MTKVYLLLRDNKQTGPHSFDELIQLGLKNDDLIWIEGKSMGWSYPSEIDAFKAHVQAVDFSKGEKKELLGAETLFNEHATSATTTTTTERSVKASTPLISKKIHISLPANSSQKETKTVSQNDLFEQKAEELRNRVREYKKVPIQDSFIETKYNRSLNDVEEDYTSWVFKQKNNKKGLSKKQLTIALIALVGVVIVLFTVKAFNREDIQQEKDIAVSETPPVQQSKPIEETNEISQPLKEEVNTENTPSEIAPRKIKSSPVVSINKTKQPNNPPTPISEKKPLPITEKKIISTEATNQLQPVVITETKEKKKIGQKIGGLFEKLKTKKDESRVEEPATSIPDNSGERNAERRDENVKGTEVDLSDFTELSSNVKSSSWMMGIRGLKITLRNKSSQTIEEASAEVRYYNDQNELLEKKIIQFSNIPSKKSVVVSAPDQRLADHINFRLLSAMGKE